MPAAAEYIFINGRFLTQAVTGVQRYAREILRTLDALLDSTNANWVILAPPGSDSGFGKELKNIRVRIVGSRSGHLWEQIDLVLASHGGILVNLCNTAPLLRGRMVTVLHDAIVYRHPAYFKWTYRTVHQFIGRVVALRSKIVTVSDFSRRELSSVLGVKAERISVIPNGSNHLRDRIGDASILERLGLSAKTFFLFVGSPAPHKNLKAAVRAYESLPNPLGYKLVIVGAAKAKVFGENEPKYPDGVVAPGRLTDDEVIALYQNAVGFIFPSFYEGFGIPPLEAFANACPVIASDIPACREVCADAALYFDPASPEALVTRMQSILDDPETVSGLLAEGRNRLALFDWTSSAQKLLAVVS